LGQKGAYFCFASFCRFGIVPSKKGKKENNGKEKEKKSSVKLRGNSQKYQVTCGHGQKLTYLYFEFVERY